ncbi:MAG: hypothetical protein VYB17_03885, partial [Candidatus Thermoplasmatota archaeon]|nr:hypothetical protein [Candidatus Thermoplasmatota archaeon]
QIVLGIGMNRVSVSELAESIGWNELFPESIEELIPVIHASVASMLEVHAMIDDYDMNCVLSSIFTSMRVTLSEGFPTSYGLDQNGGLQTNEGVVRTTGEIQWNWT